MRRRVLVLTRDLIPLPGRPTSGGGLRAWGLGEALRLRGHDVLYSVPAKLVPEGEEYDELRRVAFDPDDLQTTLLRAEPDLLVLEQWGLATHLVDTSLPVVLDLHGSLILENAFRQHRSLTSNAAAKIKALQKADLVICPGERQRAYFMAWMMMAGSNPVDIPVEVVPVSMSPDLPERSADYDGPLTLVYGGQLWPWIEPGNALSAATTVLEQTGAGTLNLFVNEPTQQEVLPYDDSSGVQAWRLPDHVRSSEVVKLEGMIPRETMISRYAAAHLAVDIYGQNTERMLAYTTRTVEYMWCGLPVVYGNYGELASLISQHQAGWVVDPDDPEAIGATLERALADRDELARRSDNARELVRQHLAWDRTIDRLDAYVRDPLIRDKGESIYGRLALEFDRIKTESVDRIETLERELKQMGEQVTNRDNRILSLTDELAHHERLLEEETERRKRVETELEEDRRQQDRLLNRQGVELAEREREIRALASRLDQAQEQREGMAEKLEAAEDLLQCEQNDHAQTIAKFDSVRKDLLAAKREIEELQQKLASAQRDLKTAVVKISKQTEEFETCRNELEGQVRTLTDGELELRKELAAEAAAADGLKRQIDRGESDNQRLQDDRQNLMGRISRLRNTWAQRTMATSQHGLRRVALQVPTVAGLFVRNLANNAYMTVWQKRHNVRIFPGQ